LLEQCCPKAVSSFRVARLPLGLRSKRFFSFIPSRGASVDQPQLQVQPRYIRTLTQRFAKFRFGLRHLPQHKVVFSHGLVSPGGIGVGAEESVDGALGKQAAGTAEVVEQVWITGTFD